MTRFAHFTEDQRHELDALWKTVIALVVILLLGIAIGFGYGLKLVSDSSDRADTALRASNQVIRDRAADARRLAAENQKKAEASARSAYAACRRQQESAGTTREFFHLIRDLSVTPSQHAEYRQLHDDLKAKHLLDVPKCIKPPKGTS